VSTTNANKHTIRLTERHVAVASKQRYQKVWLQTCKASPLCGSSCWYFIGGRYL